jgi:hypothetical protein
MSRLFDVADVEEGDGNWSAMTYDVEYDDQQPLIVTDVCTRTNTALVSGLISSGALVYKIKPFGVTVTASRPNRCVMGEFPDYEADLIAKLDREVERAASSVLYSGIPGWDNTQPYLTSSDVTAVSAGTTVQDTVPSVLDMFYQGETGLRPILHLGETAGVKISAGNALSPAPSSHEFFLAMDGTPICISPEYPTNLVAATGPIKIKRGSVGMADPQWYYDSITNNNRTIFTAMTVVAVEFNATIAVRSP